MNQYCIVMSTFETLEQAKGVIDQVLSKKMAACVQTMDIGSHYIWQGEVCHDKEILVLFKTSESSYISLKSILEEIHPYETPEIIKIPIEDGGNSYLNWIDEVTHKS